MTEVGARILPGIVLGLSLACVADRTSIRRDTDQPGGRSEAGPASETFEGGPLRATPAAFPVYRQDAIDAAMRASSTVLALGRVNGAPIPSAARALGALARAIRITGVRNPAVEERLSRIDRDVVLLESSDELDAGAPGWAMDGILAAIDAIQELDSGADAHPWTDDARTAALAIDKGLMLSFQRPILQEAFRSTADALLLVAKSATNRDAPAAVARTSSTAAVPPTRGRPRD